MRHKPQHAHLASLSLKDFTGLIFDQCPGLQPFRGSLEEIYQAFNAYKRTVPVRGAIMLDPTMTKCLLVRGYRRDAGWGFPRGKLSKGETDAECAIREVLEETGYDVGAALDPAHFIDVQLGDQATRLFIVPVRGGLQCRNGWIIRAVFTPASQLSLTTLETAQRLCREWMKPRSLPRTCVARLALLGGMSSATCPPRGRRASSCLLMNKAVGTSFSTSGRT